MQIIESDTALRCGRGDIKSKFNHSDRRAFHLIGGYRWQFPKPSNPARLERHGKIGHPGGLVGCDDRVAVTENIFRRNEKVCEFSRRKKNGGHPRPSFRAEPMAFGGSNLFRIRSNVHFV